MRRMRQNSVSRACAETRIDAGGMLPRGGRMRRADGVDTWRRTADAHADRQNCGRLSSAEEIYLPVHKRIAAEGKVAPVQAQQVPVVFGTRGRAERAPRFLSLPRRRVPTGD